MKFEKKIFEFQINCNEEITNSQKNCWKKNSEELP